MKQILLRHTKSITRFVQTFIAMGMALTPACGDGVVPSPPPGTVTNSNGQPLQSCATNGDCSQPNPYCVGGYCVECLGAANCGGRQCGPTHECVQCTTDQNCGGFTPYCNPSTFQCVQCVGAGNCAQGQTCNPVTNICQRACTSDANCSPLAPYCSPSLGVCVACVSDTNCGGGNPYCNAANGVCVECLTDANCGNGSGRCRGFRCR